MRRLVPIGLACASLAAAGCGGDEPSGGALESSLAYLPADTPFAIAFDTNLDGDQVKSLDALIERFPAGESLKGTLREELESGPDGVSFDEDVKPLLGNPFVVGSPDVASFLSDSGASDFVAAVQVDDADALDALVDKTKPDERGEVSGATVYEDDGTFFATEDDQLLLAGSRNLLDAALERADGEEHLDEATFERALEGLPEPALARTYVNLRTLIAQDPETESARRVDWVAALRTLGLTATAEDDRAEIDLRLRTDGDLSDEDLPLAPGGESPGVVRGQGEISLGVRDPRQIVTFFESAFGAVDPQGFGDYEAGKRVLAQQLDLDLDADLFGQLTGDLAVTLAPNGGFGARATPEDPRAFAATVDRLADALPQLGPAVGVSDVTRRGRLYEARLESGASLVFGMSGEAFVVASDAARARRMGASEPDAVDGATGSLVVAADAERVAAQVLQQLSLGGFLGGGLFARPLDELTGSLETSADGIRGRLSLTLD